jgi:hydrophobic/amphiphilic exporter-1 (mainly G- bacteria), HAE1 family
MLSEFFIKRPVFALVSAIVITLLGLVTLPSLPVTQYPEIAPPQVMVMAAYPGANAEVVEQSVTSPLEEAINGVERMKYMSSNSSTDGTCSITITFEQGTDPEDAVVNVQNRISKAQGRLPAEVKATGIQVNKSSDQIILGLGFFSPDKSLDPLFISNYLDRYVLDRLKRVEGVGDVRIFGERKYSMRIWLDPIKLAGRGLSAGEVANSIRSQNMDVAGGAVGMPPAPSDQNYQLNVLVKGRLADTSEFENVVVREGENGGVVRLKDVGRVELGAESYSSTTWWKRNESIGMGINQLSDANALATAQAVKRTLEELKNEFPKGLTYQVAFDSTVFVEESIKEVVATLLIAIGLVVFSIWIFLFDWRTTLIPSITIPISLVGSFLFIKMFGYSVNNLTMFGITLATGLVVDDAIVVVENIVRVMKEEKLSPLQASIKGMNEVFGAVIATSLVLIAVFVPVALFPGTTGKLYEQFAMTIAFTIIISTFNAITLTPALCAILLKPEHEAADGKNTHHKFFLFRWMDAFLKALARGYERILHLTVKLRWLIFIGFIALVGLTLLLFNSLPRGFVPAEDQGYFIVMAQAPEGTSKNYMDDVIIKVQRIIQANKHVRGVYAINGYSFLGAAANRAMMFVPLHPIGERHGYEASAKAIIDELRPQLMGLTEAFVIPFEPPPIRGIGSLGGFSFQLQDKSGSHTPAEIEALQWQLIGSANTSGTIEGAFASFTSNTPQLQVKVDRDKAIALGVPTSEIFSALQVLLGSLYINDFNYNGRVYRVVAQADHPYRATPRAMESIYVKSNTAQMLPLTSLVNIKEVTGPQVISHYNMFRSTEISGSPMGEASSGQAIEKMEAIAKEQLPPGFSFEWSGLSLEQKDSGSTEAALFGLGLVFVYLVLAAQYESFVIPFIIVLAVPTAILGAVLALKIRGMPNDVFSQLGLVMLIGLASKNSILIVEFAKHLHEQGHSLVDAAIQASVIRLRPILMTALSFIFGVWPLVIATGAGAYARQSLGTSVFGGMLLSTGLTLLIVPVLFILIMRLEGLFKNRSSRHANLAQQKSASGPPVNPPGI